MTARYEAAAWPCPIIGAEDAHMAVLWHYWPDENDAAGGWLEVARYLSDDVTVAKAAAGRMYDTVRANLQPNHSTEYTWRGARPAGTGPGPAPSAEHPVTLNPNTADMLSSMHYVAWTAVERDRLARLED